MISLEKSNGFIARYHPNGDFGSPYTAVAFVVPDWAEGSAMVKGAMGEINISVVKELKTVLAQMGIYQVTWERRDDNGNITKETSVWT